jgi:glycosyltransferase involved in cell wall biosynthesis
MARRLIVLAPIEPARTGNGLAMRASLFCRSASSDVELLTIVVPVAGSLNPGQRRSPGVVEVPADHGLARAGVTALIGQEVWRERLARVDPLPPLARMASPGLAAQIVRACRGRAPVALHVMRSYMAPLAVATAEQLRPAWLTLDLDEDDSALAASYGNLDGAAAYDRLLSVFGPLFNGLCAASAPEAASISSRLHQTVECVPNAIDLPEPRVGRAGDDRGVVSLLFVGNLTYPPNVEAAQLLVEEILPRVQRRLAQRVRLVLVGRHVPELRGVERPGVELKGFVSDLRSVYAAADVVVVPITKGAGTRIKLIEAFAYGVPVVASATAAAGLEVVDGRHLCLAEDPDHVAAAIERVLGEPGLAPRLVDAARGLVRDRYATNVVVPRIREFFDRAAARSVGRPQSGASR